MRIQVTLLFFLLSLSTNLFAQTAADFTLTTTDDEEFSLYSGHLDKGTTVVLEIFFVDCPPCRKLAPQIATLHKTLVTNEIDVEFISISFVNGDTKERIAEFKNEFNHDWPFVVRNEESQAVLDPYINGTFGTFFGTPTTLVIAPDGTVSNIRGNLNIEGDWTKKLEEKILETQESKTDNNEQPMDPPPATAIVTGGINTTKGEGLAGVIVNFSGGKDTSIVSGELGTFQTGSLLADENYTVSLEKNDDLNNGVTTLDIVLISKHILGIERFSKDFQMIAADVNKSGSVTTFDLVLIRQVILGSRTEFPGTKSWVFQPAEVEISSLQELDALAFNAIKIGDINESAKTNGLLDATERNRYNSFDIAVQDQQFRAGEQVQMALNGADLKVIQGFQFTLQFDPNVLVLNDLENGDLSNFSTSNTNLNFSKKGLLSTSWNGQVKEDATTLFKLSFTALSNGRLSDFITLNSTLTKAESYDLTGEILDVDLSFKPAAKKTLPEISLYPNPVKSDKFFLSFEHAKPQEVRVQISNINGQLVQSFDYNLTEGTHLLKFDLPNLLAGVYTVQVLAADKILESTQLIKQ